MRVASAVLKKLSFSFGAIDVHFFTFAFGALPAPSVCACAVAVAAHIMAMQPKMILFMTYKLVVGGRGCPSD